jgi:hypothetical protein
MGGMLDIGDELLGNDERRASLMILALDFVGSLPSK